MKKIEEWKDLIGLTVKDVEEYCDEEIIVTFETGEYVYMKAQNNCGEIEVVLHGDIEDIDIDKQDLVRLGVITQESIDEKLRIEKEEQEARNARRETREFETYAELHLKFTGKRVVR